MKTVLTLILIFTGISLASAQHRFGGKDGVSVQEMTGKEYLQFDENSSKLFWAIDLNIFNDTQKSTFQELVFNSDNLVAISTPDVNNFWYLASFKIKDIEIVKTELNKMIEKSRILTTNPEDKYK